MKMSKKIPICSATYNISLNQDEDDVFRTGCANLYHFIHVNGNNGRSSQCKPMTLKMHLELSELIEDAEGQLVEHSNSNNADIEVKFQSLENSLQANNADAVKKLMERMEKLEKNLSNHIVNNTPDVSNNTIDHETNNALLNISDNFPRQSYKQLEEKLKTLEDALHANGDVINKIMEFLEKKFEKNLSNIIVNKATDVGNNTIAHETNNALLCSSVNAPRQSIQQLEKEVKDLKDRIEQLELIKAVNETIDCKEYQTTPKEKKEIQFNKDNLVVIVDIKSSDSSLETAIHNVIKYAKEMDLSLTSDQIKHIDVRICNENSLVYYVFFRTRAIKERFLMKSDILRRSPHSLQIVNESEYNTVYIRNFKSSDLSYDSVDNVIGLANQMGLTLKLDQIKWIEVFRVNQSSTVCRVKFYTTQMENEFLNKSHILKELPATKSFEIY